MAAARYGCAVRLLLIGAVAARLRPASAKVDADGLEKRSPGYAMTRVLLEDAAAKTGAVCLDGSPGAYYLAPGTGDGARKWYIHFQGGGWCYNLQDCLGRSRGILGSSKSYPETWSMHEGGYWSDDPRSNPLMHSWNKVFVKYCDGASFTGRNMTTTVVENTTLFFRGKLIMEAVQRDLLSRGLADSTDVVLSGCSAGGLATYLHLDDWGALLAAPGRKVVGMPDSGFFLDYESRTIKYRSNMEWVFRQHNSSSGVHPGCIAVHSRDGSNPAKCMFAEHNVPFIRTPLFALQATYDSWQIGNDLEGNADAKTVNAWGQKLTELLEGGLLEVNPAHGAFLDGCQHHCLSGEEWNTYSAAGTVISAAFKEWYEMGAPALPNKGFFAQRKAYPCKECCQGEAGTGARRRPSQEIIV